jgi:twitching motility two-component system response regulator PilH
MAFAFDSQSFGHVLNDAEDIAARALDLEHRLVTLVNGLDGECGRVAGAIRTICTEARSNRQLADGLLIRLIGNTAQENGSGRPRVLVVDDSQDNLEMVAMLLENSGFEAITANNGLEALIVAHYSRPVVVLMDLTMPVLNGLEAARVLKASEVTQDLNVIAYTAKPEFYEPPFTKFFVDVLKKPSTPEAILASVRRFAGDASLDA